MGGGGGGGVVTWCVRNGGACLKFSEEQNTDMGFGSPVEEQVQLIRTHTHIEDTKASAVLKLSLPYTHTHTDFIIDNMLKKTPNTGLAAFPISQTAVTLTSHTKTSRMLGPRWSTLSRKLEWCWCVYVCVVIAAGIFSQDGLSQFPLVA